MMETSMFKNKRLLITGGTGSFGNAVLRRFLDTDIAEIRILSRDEKKQDDIRRLYNSPQLKCYLGDVRDYQSVLTAVRGVDYIFHAAALKQVPSCEFYPLEAVKTNILGAENVLEAAVAEEVERVVWLSTDKAGYPINAMGISKAMMEKVIISKARSLNASCTQICTTRYGNVMASRGSVIPLFVRQLLNNQPVTITDPEMTRFMMTLDDAVDLVLYAFDNGRNGDTFVQKAPAATISVLFEALSGLLCDKAPKMEVIGTRHGEKVYETLCSREEMVKAVDEGNYFRIPADQRDLNYGLFFEHGSQALNKVTDYNTHNTHRLTVSEMTDLLMKLKFVRDTADGLDAAPYE